jgi:hypothetical protein
VSQTLKTSVNIKFDLGDEDLVSRYLPTPSHADVIKGVLKGIEDPTQRRSHLVVGAYGTGKSLLGSILSGIATHRIVEDTYHTFREKFRLVDDEIFELLDDITSDSFRYIPVILNGFEGRFRNAILTALARSLKENNISIRIPSIPTHILKTVERWELEFPYTYNMFLNILKESNKSLDDWKITIEEYDEAAIDIFISNYPKLTSGAEFVYYSDEDFVGHLTSIAETLREIGIGIFLVYDEFGRVLQNVKKSDIPEVMQDLQDLAEIVDHVTTNMHLVFIVHKNLRQYFLLHGDEYQHEFQRIEKRFLQYYVETDSATFVRLTSTILSQKNIKPISKKKFNEMVQYLRLYPIFPMLNQTEIENVIIKGAFPIHPVSLYLLPILSNTYAQNERTLFTFLESNEKGGFLSSKSIFTPDKLFSFFFPTIDELVIADQSGYGKVLKKALSKAPTIYQSENELKLLKFIALWHITSSHGHFPLTSDFISFSLGLSKEDTEKSLEKLELWKVVRFNRILDYWELFEGSSVDIDLAIKSKRSNYKLSTETTKNILFDLTKNKYYLPFSYNDEKKMTRFASVKYIFSNELLALDWHPTKNDSIVFYVLPSDKEDIDASISFIEATTDSRLVFALLSEPTELLFSYVYEYNILQSLLLDREWILQDKHLEQEICLRIEDTSFEISKILTVFENFSELVTWYNMGQRVSIKNQNELSSVISKAMYEWYPDTPVIQHENFNRRKITAVQKKGAITVIDRILLDHQDPDDQLGILGQGPDYLIYSTVFKQHQYSFLGMAENSHTVYEPLKQLLINHIKNNPEGNLYSLVSILENRPFGIRSPIVPILIVGLLREIWDQLMFYSREMYIPSQNGTIIWDMMEEPSRHSYVFLEYSEKDNEYFNILLEEFGPYVSEFVANKPKPIRVSSGLLRWLRQLPRYSQICNNVPRHIDNLRTLIRKTEVDPKGALEDLLKEYQAKPLRIYEDKRELEKLFDKTKRDLENYVFKTLDLYSVSEIHAWANQQSPFLKKNNRLIDSLIQIENYENWIERLSYAIMGVPLNDWSDATIDMFKYQLSLLKEETLQGGTQDTSTLNISINGTDKVVKVMELSAKSKTLQENVRRMLKMGGRTLPKEEVEYLVINLLDEFIK